MTFHQRCNVTLLGAGDEIAFPVAGDGTVLDFRGPFWRNGYGVDDLTAAVPAITRVPCAANDDGRPEQSRRAAPTYN